MQGENLKKRSCENRKGKTEADFLSDFYTSGVWNVLFKLLLCVFEVRVDYVNRVNGRRCLKTHVDFWYC